MQLEVTITADDAEIPAVVDAIADLATDVDITVEGADGDDIVANLTEKERYVIAAVQAAPGSALRIIHERTNKLGGSPFDGYSEEDGWNDEREEVRDLLWTLQDDDLTRNDGQRWYPGEAAPANILG